MSADLYLETWLAPLLPVLGHGDVTDLYVNRPGEVWIEELGHAPRLLAMPELDEERLWRIARQIASLSHQGISRAHPLLSATLPDGARVQVVAPPATRGPMAIAIRKHVVAALSLDDYLAAGAFAGVAFSQGWRQRPPIAPPASNAPEVMAAFLAAQVRARRNILISGGTSTGKTTFLNSLIGEIASDERLIAIEDTPELRLPQPNTVGLLAVRGELGEAQVDSDALLQASLRMRPDRIILGEIRGREAYSFLRAINTGHPGSLSTIHADSPEGAIEQLALIVLQSGVSLRREDIIAYATQVIDIVIQLDRRGGLRAISQVMLTRGGGD
ncbi:MAG: P-type DNA transfer ATPase VirB11 [Sphingomonadales bacterium]|nr:P-type DNA transfer ATPase VirB11 [Sphingomonadales bacterium]